MRRPSLGDVWPVADPSEFIHQIVWLEQQTVNDESGVSVVYAASSPPSTTWCKIEWMRGEDVIKSGQDTSQLYGTVTIHYRPGIVANRRIQAPGGGVYIIRSVENVRLMNMFYRINIVALGA